MTRAEAAKLLATGIGLELTEGDNFLDVPNGRWFTKYVSALKVEGIASGYKDGTFHPGEYLTRAEAIKMIVSSGNFRLDDFQIQNIRNYAYCPFTDITRQFWAYPYILRAAGLA